jgi:hypothetical protein
MHLRPRKTQIYQFLQMAVTIVTDLQYDLPLEERDDHTTPSSEELSSSIRAYLGCYYLSSA